MFLHPNDVIPIGYGPGIIHMIVNGNGLLFLPPGCIVRGKGDAGYWDVEARITVESQAALALLGVSETDILSALTMH